MKNKEDQPKEAISLFPVSGEAINQALSEIEANPDVAMLEEGEFLRLHNPQLNSWLFTLLRTNAGGAQTYIEGALWAHRMIRVQARSNGMTLPKLTEQMGEAEVKERIANMKGKSGLGINQFYLTEADEIEKRDPEFGHTIKNLTQYRVDRWQMVAGMVDVYRMLARADTNSRLSSLIGT